MNINFQQNQEIKNYNQSPLHSTIFFLNLNNNISLQCSKTLNKLILRNLPRISRIRNFLPFYFSFASDDLSIRPINDSGVLLMSEPFASKYVSIFLNGTCIETSSMNRDKFEELIRLLKKVVLTFSILC